MSSQLWIELIVGFACLVGIVGTVVPVLPGAFLVVTAIAVWSIATGGTTAWLVLGFAVVIVGIGTVLKYLIPGRSLRSSGVPWWVIGAGGILAVVGFFVIPFVGLFVGFVAGVYFAEVARLRGFALAWPTTVQALKAVGVSTLIDLTCAVLPTVVWLSAVILT